MQCPVDASPLQITERQGVEIDYCPSCRGVWLDRGELDKIIDRNADLFERQEREPRPSQRPSYQGGYSGHPHKRRKGFLGELFDFD